MIPLVKTRSYVSAMKEASVSLLPHSSQNSIRSEEEEEWIICELDDLGNLIEEWLRRAEAAT